MQQRRLTQANTAYFNRVSSQSSDYCMKKMVSLHKSRERLVKQNCKKPIVLEHCPTRLSNMRNVFRTNRGQEEVPTSVINHNFKFLVEKRERQRQ